MGNTQGSSKRDRHESGGFRKGNYPDEDHRPFELRIPNSTLSPSSSNLSMQYVNTSEYPVVIKWNSAPARAVCVSGSWDSWRTRIPMVKSKEDFTTIINLPEGKHEFKFLVDSQWQCDNRLPKTTSISGIENNFIEVNHDDFDVSDALDKDLQVIRLWSGATLASGATKPDGSSASYPSNQTGHDSSTPTSSPLDLIKFGQEVPDRPAFSTAPPSLPPHLLQVILNKDTPLSCDPNVLPEPNHVMLNHLYALSIKDGVMVLSATHRYRKKYVTTLLYKPIG